MLHQPGSGRGGSDRAAFDQPGAQIGFEGGDVLGDRGLRIAEGRGGDGERAVVEDRDEGAQQMWIHGHQDR
ncbi:hypothetical protein Sgleb_06080 [Streptomyces glebosus]|uniref:Uncharacterized protein n=1 Tax=Streptomyces glebosus TaxID=249580 RepID=A0A640SQG4_9ACTN|nr:hypothetical protein Sgleb_06080 [Streptomyces glebosus]GHG71298.1 hypothetical protein GCM10010513_43290 [Streptomyces glebosus]